MVTSILMAAEGIHDESDALCSDNIAIAMVGNGHAHDLFHGHGQRKSSMLILV